MAVIILCASECFSIFSVADLNSQITLHYLSLSMRFLDIISKSSGGMEHSMALGYHGIQDWKMK